jgi:hypothetical protein
VVLNINMIIRRRWIWCVPLPRSNFSVREADGDAVGLNFVYAAITLFFWLDDEFMRLNYYGTCICPDLIAPRS